MLEVRQGDNLETLRQLKAEGAKFDLVELDGPYMAGLEGWDTLTEAEYIDHYAERLTIIRELLQPWGVVFVFGFPEGCAEIKSWAHRTGTLYCRRWLSWYKQVTAHKGRKVETILLFTVTNPTPQDLVVFGGMLKKERLRRGWSLRELGAVAGKEWWYRGGNFYFETGKNTPTVEDYGILRQIFGLEDKWNVIAHNYEGVTNVDFMAKTYSENTKTLNDNGLRSKPVQLYLDLFKPTIPPIENRKALVLYGGSGNAGIAAAALGYDVTVCEADPKRCAAISGRWAIEVQGWKQKLSQMDIFEAPPVQQMGFALAAAAREG